MTKSPASEFAADVATISRIEAVPKILEVVWPLSAWPLDQILARPNASVQTTPKPSSRTPGMPNQTTLSKDGT